MLENPRNFEAGPDPFGRKWTVTLRWLQNGISIRHADTIDVKYELVASDATEMEKVVALPHPLLQQVSRKLDRPIRDSWCIRMASQHILFIIETWVDSEKTIVTPTLEQIEAYATQFESTAAPAR